jgi:hypothetical protein
LVFAVKELIVAMEDLAAILAYDDPVESLPGQGQ